MAAQTWFAANWIQPNWNSADWYASTGGDISRSASLVGPQADNYLGGSRWVNPDWFAGMWFANDWFAHPGGIMVVSGALQQFSVQFIIPNLDIMPQWIFRVGGGIDVRLVGPQSDQSMNMKGVFLNPASTRIAFLDRVQADQVASMRMTFSLNPLSRQATLTPKQEDQVPTINATFAFSGAGNPKRYGRRHS